MSDLQMSKKTPDLHNQLSRILDYLEEYDTFMSDSELEASMHVFARLYPLLPGHLPEMYSLLRMMSATFEGTMSAMQECFRMKDDHRKKAQAAKSSSSDTKRPTKAPFALRPEDEASRRLKQDFLLFAQSWFYKVSFTLKPYWTQKVVDVINTHHHPICEHRGLEHFHEQLITSIEHVKHMAGIAPGGIKDRTGGDDGPEQA